MAKIKTIDDLYTFFLKRKFDKISKIDVLTILKNTNDIELSHFLEHKYEFFIHTLIFGETTLNYHFSMNYIPRFVRNFNERNVSIISYLYQKSLNIGSLDFEQYLNTPSISFQHYGEIGFDAYVKNTDLDDISNITKAMNVKNIVIIGLINPDLFVERMDFYKKLKDIHLLYPELFKIKMDHSSFCYKLDTIQLLKLNINDLDIHQDAYIESDIYFSN